MFQVIAYLKFLLNSSNQHGVHSPFVYNLITQCFYDELSKSKKLNFIQRLLLQKRETSTPLIPIGYTPKEIQKKVYPQLTKYRQELLNNQNTINVSDFGAGSRVFKSNQRVIAKIAKTAGITPKRAELLARIVRYLNISTVLELGTSLGIATAAMAIDHKKIAITTIEGCPETAKVAQQQFSSYKLNQINSIVANFDAYLADNQQIFDLVYVDGNHQKQATLNYFNSLLKNTHSDTVFIFDDIHWSKGMEEAWSEIKTHPQVTLTIDTFFWGFVFFRTENKVKEHFKVRL